MTLAQILSIPAMERRVWTYAPCSPAQVEVKDRDRQALMRSTWATLYMRAGFGTDGDGQIERAHENCLSKHTCGTYDEFTDFMQHESTQKEVHALHPLAICYDPTPCDFKEGLPFYCCAEGGCGVTPKEFFMITP